MNVMSVIKMFGRFSSENFSRNADCSSQQKLQKPNVKCDKKN